MRLLRIGPAGAERPAMMAAGGEIDVVEAEIDRLGRRRHVVGQA